MSQMSKIQNAATMIGPFKNVCETTSMRRFLATVESTFELFEVTAEKEKKLVLRSLIASHKSFAILELKVNKTKTYDELIILLIAIHDGDTKKHWSTASKELTTISYLNFSSLADYFRRVCELHAELDGKVEEEFVIHIFTLGLPPQAATYCQTQKFSDLMAAFTAAAKICQPSDFKKPEHVSEIVPVNQVRPRAHTRQCYLCGKKGHEHDDCTEGISIKQLYPDQSEEFYNGFYEDEKEE